MKFLIKLSKLLCCLGAVLFVIYIARGAYAPTNPFAIQGLIQLFQKATEDNVVITAHALTAQETRTYLHHDLIRRGFQPVLLLIENRSRYSYCISKKDVVTKAVSGKRVAKEIARPSLGLAITYEILGCLWWPFSIPATLDMLCSFAKERAMRKEFHAKTIKMEGETIIPYSSVARVLYIPHENITGVCKLSITQIESKEKQDFCIPIKYYTE